MIFCTEAQELHRKSRIRTGVVQGIAQEVNAAVLPHRFVPELDSAAAIESHGKPPPCPLQLPRPEHMVLSGQGKPTRQSGRQAATLKSQT
jgi:hypothetical protein